MANLSNINNYFVVDTTGKVAIGDVSAATIPTLLTQLTLYDNTATASLVIQSGAASGKKYELGSSSTGKFQITDLDASVDRLTIDTAGNVGIGMTSPTAKLDVTSSGVVGRFISSSNEVPVTIFHTSNSRSTLGFKGSTSTNDYNVRVGADGNDFIAYTNNAERLRINSSGNVGIGKTNPQVRLDIAGDVSIPYGNKYFMDTVGAARSNFLKTINSYETVVGTSRGSAGFGVFGNSNIRLGFGTNYTTAQTSLFINSSGNVGIGTASPASKLEIGGGRIGIRNNIVAPSNLTYSTIYSTENTGAAYPFTGTSGNLVVEPRNGQDFVVLGSSGVAKMVVKGAGKVGIGTTSPYYKLVVSNGGASGIEFSPAALTGLNEILSYNRSTSAYENLRLSVYGFDIYTNNGGNSLAITNTGQVGIGTASPTAKLDIAGDVRYQGSIYSEYTYNGSGNYSNGTIYTIASTGQLTVNGMYQIVMYLDDYGAGGNTYFCWFCSVPFYWVTTGTNRVVSQALPTLIGTGHAIGPIPTFYITQEMGTSGGQAKIRFNPNNNWTGINGTSSKQFTVYIKRLGG